ncbi:MAG: hypothetical protein ABI144_07390 [Gallionella sp.]
MNRDLRIFYVIFIVFLSGCASPHKPESAKPNVARKSTATKQVGRTVMSPDGLTKGEIIGTPAPASRFSQLQIGMRLKQVTRLIGPPDSSDSRITGKQYQPFYFGGDTQRTEAFYKNEGQLTFSNTSSDSAPDTLIRIRVNPNANGKH